MSTDSIYKNILETMAQPNINRRTFLKVGGTIVAATVLGPGCLKSGSSTPEIADYLTGDAVVDGYLSPLVDEAIKNGNNAALANYKELGTNLKKQAGEIRSQYSVPVTIVIAEGFSGNPTAWLKPDKVDWDATHTNLLYNLTKPQEATLAIAEVIHAGDVSALENLTSNEFKEKIRQKGKTLQDALEQARKTYPRLSAKEPELFEIVTKSILPKKVETELLYRNSEAYIFDLTSVSGQWLL